MDISEEQCVMFKFFIKCGYTSTQTREHLKCGFYDTIFSETAVFDWFEVVRGLFQKSRTVLIKTKKFIFNKILY